jgi:inner membrane protein
MKQLSAWRQYRAKAFALLCIGLVLEFAITDISALLNERSDRQKQAEEDIRRMAGTEQIIEGPVFGIETTEESIAVGTSGEAATRYDSKKLKIVPFKQATIKAQVATEERYRGIYALETYVSTVDIAAEVIIPPTESSDISITPQSSPKSQRGLIFIGLSGKQFIQSLSEVSLNGKPLTLTQSPRPDIVTFEVPLTNMTAGETSHSFHATLKVRGTRGIAISPMSHSYDLTLESASQNPSFVGAILPLERTIDEKGSRASWHGDPVSTSLSCYPECESISTFFNANASPMGADFLGSLKGHSMVERAIKYRTLVIVLTFGVYLLFEFVTKVRIHPLQYLLVGAALTLYYLLLLSLTEQLGFSLAYASAAIVTIGLISGYSSAILRSRKHGGVIASLLMSIYAFLFTVLKEQEAALLFGSIGLTLFLGIFMFVTRRIDWYELIPTNTDEVKHKGAEYAPLLESADNGAFNN